jgi:hypothetical protein
MVRFENNYYRIVEKTAKDIYLYFNLPNQNEGKVFDVISEMMNYFKFLN